MFCCEFNQINSYEGHDSQKVLVSLIKSKMTEWEVEELVRKQTREFKREIEKRFNVSKHNHSFVFPLEPTPYSNDSSIASLETTEVCNLNHQNNVLGLRKKSMSEKLIRLPDFSRNPPPKSQERQKKNETSAERVALTNRPIALTLAPSSKKPNHSEHQAESPYQPYSQRHQAVIYKDQSKPTIPSAKQSPINSYVDLNKSTQMIQQKIQRIIQESIQKQDSRTPNDASLHQAPPTKANQENTNPLQKGDPQQQTNHTLLKLLQKNGLIKQEPRDTVATPTGLVDKSLGKIQMKPLTTNNRQISLRQLKSPAQNSKSFFSKHNNTHGLPQDSSINQSGSSFHRTYTQHNDSNNTSRSYISNMAQATRQPSGSKYNANTSRLKDFQVPVSPTITTGNKSFQENSYVISNQQPLRVQAQQPEPVIQNYIQIDNYLNQTRSYQSNTALRQNQDRIKDHMIKIGCITGRNATDRTAQGQGKYYPRFTFNQKESNSKGNFSMGY